MFRDNKAKFGKGSTINAGAADHLVIEMPGKKCALLNLITLTVSATIDVEDPKHLSSTEAGQLAGLIEKNYCFSDFTFKPNAITKENNRTIITGGY